jgi:hypothetical protein
MMGAWFVGGFFGMCPRCLLLVFVSAGSMLIGVDPSVASAQFQQAMPASTAYPQNAAPYREQPTYASTSAYASPSASPYPSSTNASSPYAPANDAASPVSAIYSPTVSPYDNVIVNGSSQPPGVLGAGAPTGSQGQIQPDGNGVQAVPGFGAMQRNDYVEQALADSDNWTWQSLPTGLLYKADLASPYETRLASRWTYSRGVGKVWDATAGARFGIFRYGTDNDIWPQGWQFDVGAAAFPRLDQSGDVLGNDYTFVAPLTMRQGRWEWEFGYRHYCSHIADEYLLKNKNFDRINYVRDSMFTGLAFYVTADLRLYFETGWGFYDDGGAKPWEFQFGVDFSPAAPTTVWGAPFAALNAHLTEENDFGGSFTAQAGWQWRGRAGHLLRIGAHYVNGMSEQRQFFRQWEQQIGGGVWYDF